MFNTKRMILMIALFIISLPVFSQAQTVNLPKTGQTTCYDAAGAVIACPTTGQDGDIQSGVAWPSPRFTDNLDGTITDNLTGLMWLQDANCIVTQYPGFDADGMVPWQNALDFVAGIDSGTYPNCGATYTDWRLPNVNELESLVNAEETNPATWLNTQGFSNVQSYYYWSSTTYADNTGYAWYVYMGDGYVFRSYKPINNYVWPVRAGQ